jgi:hypothetical protein
MQGWKSHVLVSVHLMLVAGLLVAGCSTKEDPNEVLDLCGNHSCGSLTMVTTDTSSDGFQYLEPVLTDDGSTIYFTADYAALTPTDRPIDPMPKNRQIMFMPVREGVQPVRRLAQCGADVMRYMTLNYFAGGQKSAELEFLQKGSPKVIDEQTLLIWVGLDRGARLVKLDLNTGIIQARPETLYMEPEDYSGTGGFWQHRDPAVSPDRKWVAFSRFGYQERLDSLSTYTGQSIWVVSLERGAAVPRPRAFPITTEASLAGQPAWSPDGRWLAFQGDLSFGGEMGGRSGTEIYTISFDTTGLAANRGVPLNRDLRRVTYTTIDFGNPLRGIQNTKPVFTADGSEIVFVSTRRAPSITLHDRNIWRVPADGRLEPQILFFSRVDDVDPHIPRGSHGTLLLSSAMGFPTEMLSRIEEEIFQQLMAEVDEDSVAVYTEPEARVKAQLKRRDLEFFERVMSHLFIFRGW